MAPAVLDTPEGLATEGTPTMTTKTVPQARKKNPKTGRGVPLSTLIQDQVRPDAATAAALDVATRADVQAVHDQNRIAELEAALDNERRRSARLGAYAFKLAGFTDDVSEDGALEEYFDVAIREVEILELATQSQSTFPVSLALGRLWDRMRAMNDGAEEIVAAAAQYRAFESAGLRQGKVSP